MHAHPNDIALTNMFDRFRAMMAQLRRADKDHLADDYERYAIEQLDELVAEAREVRDLARSVLESVIIAPAYTPGHAGSGI